MCDDFILLVLLTVPDLKFCLYPFDPLRSINRALSAAALSLGDGKAGIERRDPWPPSLEPAPSLASPLPLPPLLLPSLFGTSPLAIDALRI
mmetsp:Transcript_40915/g.73517  ORF Transcript_40915/g.73517 Transcript_40915/m.73517 type:complete len:91 (-) Transcript_40915:476-748(-)